MLNHRYEPSAEVFNGANSVSVWMCNDKATGKKVMIKTFPKSNFEASFFYHEMEVNRIAEGDNVIKVLDNYETRTSFNLVMEAGSMDFLDYIEASGPIKEGEFMKLFKGLTKAIVKLHEKNVLHNDLKLENIVVKDGNLYLIDFGLSDIMTENNQNNNNNKAVGTTFYTAPEIFSDNIRSKKSDVYSFGIVMFTSMTGQYPFDSENSFCYSIQQMNTPPNLDALRENNISEKMVDLIGSCLSVNPDQRPTMRYIFDTLWPEDSQKENSC